MWLLPSLSRPANLVRFFAACKETGTTTPGAVLIDSADYAKHQQAYAALQLPLGWHVWTTKGVTQGDKIREIWHEIKDSAWLGLIGDDNIPETPGWDKLLVDQLASAGIVSCDDGWQAPRRIGNCWVMSGSVIRAVDYIFAPGMHHLFVDDLWEQLGRETGAWECRQDIMVRHAHVMKGEAQIDDTHRAAYGSGFTQDQPGPDRDAGLWAGDEEAFRDWRAYDKDRAVRAILDLSPPPLSVTRKIRNNTIEARAKTRSVLICTPEKDRYVRGEFTHSLYETGRLLTQLGIKHFWIENVGTANLPKARNELAATFLASPFDEAMLIDDDMGWEPSDLVKLLGSRQPFIGAAGPKRMDFLPDTDVRRWCFLPLVWETDKPQPRDEMGNVEVEGIGTGFLKLSREVFERIILAHSHLKRPGRPELPQHIRDHYYRFFEFPDNDDETGEDYAFCRLWRSIGGKAWIDPTINLIHAGDKDYGGDITALFKTAD